MRHIEDDTENPNPAQMPQDFSALKTTVREAS
jgi:hypothetical protein